MTRTSPRLALVAITRQGASQAEMEKIVEETTVYARVSPENKLQIVEALKARGHVGSYQILELLGIAPGESEAIKAVSKQLEEMEAYGLVTNTSRGWRWIG